MCNDRRSWISLVSGILLIALASFRVDALGAKETAVREVRDFDSVSLSTSGELIITQGDQEALQIVASGGAMHIPFGIVKSATNSK